MDRQNLNSAYTNHITFHFECAGEGWAVTDWSEDTIIFEELRKNGQEDTHISGAEVCFEDGKWKLDEDPGESWGVLFYRDAKTAAALEEFFNKNGTPS